MISLKEIFKKCPSSWKSVHKYKEEMTSIEFESRENQSLPYLLKIGIYPKPFTFAQGEIFRMLLEHLITEKIEHLNTFIKKPTNTDEFKSTPQNILYVKEETTNT
jgi:3'-phosphoadenosine 5'-phosphosulfate sulfotransferase